MKDKTFGVMLVLLFAPAAALGQTTFQGITPGKSTRAEAEQVLGRPVNQVSATLVEYKERTLNLAHTKVTLNSGKTFVQYRDDGSAASIAERIELIVCPLSKFDLNKQCGVQAMTEEYDPRTSEFALAGASLDAVKTVHEGDKGFKIFSYYGPPRYMIFTKIVKYTDLGSYDEMRWAFYSRELYDAVAPRRNCTGRLRGEWETNRGRMTITRLNEYGRVQGTYLANNGTFTGTDESNVINGEWKDNTGSGTMRFSMFSGKEFKGTWKRTSGSGPREGVWSGRCVEATTN